jgi:hypothetical protein
MAWFKRVHRSNAPIHSISKNNPPAANAATLPQKLHCASCFLIHCQLPGHSGPRIAKNSDVRINDIEAGTNTAFMGESLHVDARELVRGQVKIEVSQFAAAFIHFKIGGFGFDELKAPQDIGGAFEDEQFSALSVHDQCIVEA